MISISRLLCDNIGPGDALRYDPKSTKKHNGHDTGRTAPQPIVVWNCTRRCNLGCIHCYASAGKGVTGDAMSTEEAKSFILNLADFGVPVLLFSGGEPLLRKDLFDLATYAKNQGLRVVLSTNGTLVDKGMAERIAGVGFAEVGISLDGVAETNDYFRDKTGAYDAALTGIRNCIAGGERVSLRLTVTRHNYQEIPNIFHLAEEEGVNRICFYHLAYSGRADNLRREDLDHHQTRGVMDTIFRHTVDLHSRDLPKEVLTVANHADGVYLYLSLKDRDARRAEIVLDLLTRNGGNNSGIRIGAVDDQGDVHPDQFWRQHILGNVRERPFGDIWTDSANEFLMKLKIKKEYVTGRCARCRFLDICGGNFRARAEAVTGELWAPDPACYLTDEEIGLQ